MGLIETVARAICLNRAAPACKCKDDGVCKAPAENLLTESNERLSQARAAVLAVLDHFSEPGNVTDKMADECACTPESLDDARDMVADAFRAALRAARDGVSRG